MKASFAELWRGAVPTPIEPSPIKLEKKTRVEIPPLVGFAVIKSVGDDVDLKFHGR
jgi:hypothetical protein